MPSGESLATSGASARRPKSSTGAKGCGGGHLPFESRGKQELFPPLGILGEAARSAGAAPGGQSTGAGQSCLLPRAFKRLRSTSSPCPALPNPKTAPGSCSGCRPELALSHAVPRAPRPGPCGVPPPRPAGGPGAAVAPPGVPVSRCPRRTLRFLRQLHWPILLLAAPRGQRRGSLLCERGVRGSWRGKEAKLSSRLLGEPPLLQRQDSSSSPSAGRGRSPGMRRRSCRDTSPASSQVAAETSVGAEGPRGADPRPEGRPGHLPAARAVPGVRGLRRAGVLYRGGVSGSSVVQGVSFGSLARGQRGAGKRLLPGHTGGSPSNRAWRGRGAA